jgi:IS5 family transposase
MRSRFAEDCLREACANGVGQFVIARIELRDDVVPDETTILRFRHLLEYRGLAKNLARAQTMFALANLYQLRRELLPAGSRC